jgi:hypothetical protein
MEDDGSTYILHTYTVTDDCPKDENGDYMTESGYNDGSCPHGFFCNPQDVFSTALSIQPCPLGYTLLTTDDSDYDGATYGKSLATTCKRTTAGKYVDFETWGLVDCPLGFYCPEGTARSTQFPCPAGTYRD